MKNNFYLPCQFFENRRSMRMLLFLSYGRSDQTFYSQTKVNFKTSKIIASRCYTWSLGIKQSLNRQGLVKQKENSSKSSAWSRSCKLTFHSHPSRFIGYKHFPEYFFHFVRFYVIVHQKIDLKRSSTYRCPFYWESEAFIRRTNTKKTITRLLRLLRSQLHK